MTLSCTSYDVLSVRVWDRSGTKVWLHRLRVVAPARYPTALAALDVGQVDSLDALPGSCR